MPHKQRTAPTPSPSPPPPPPPPPPLPQVETFFHEFGHGVHNLCSMAKIPAFAGTSVERDFVEAPSQMLENWCWEEEPLRRMSGLYTNESEALPDPLLTSMVAAKNLNSALMTLRQVFVTSPETLNHKPQTLVRRP